MIALLGGGSELARQTAAALLEEHSVAVLDPSPPAFRVDEHRPVSDTSLEALTELLGDVEAVVHAGCYDPSWAQPGLPPDQALLDVGGRVTYNLLHACRRARVPRLIFCSTLASYAAYDADLLISAQLPPRPSTDPFEVACALGEAVCREVVREWSYPLAILRLGKLVREEEVAGQPFDPLWVDVRDAGWAIAHAVDGGGGGRRSRWGVHGIPVCADRPDAANGGGSAWGHQVRKFADCPAREEVAR